VWLPYGRWVQPTCSVLLRRGRCVALFVCLTALLRGAHTSPVLRAQVILYDGVCGLCNRGVNFVLHFDRHKLFRFAALQSPTGRQLLERYGRAADDLSSIVLCFDDRALIKSDAVLSIGAVSPLCRRRRSSDESSTD